MKSFLRSSSHERKRLADRVRLPLIIPKFSEKRDSGSSIPGCTGSRKTQAWSLSEETWE